MPLALVDGCGRYLDARLRGLAHPDPHVPLFVVHIPRLSLGLGIGVAPGLVGLVVPGVIELTGRGTEDVTSLFLAGYAGRGLRHILRKGKMDVEGSVSTAVVLLSRNYIASQRERTR